MRRILLIGYGILLCGILISFGFYSFPPPYEDSIVYIPPAIFFAAEKGLINPIFPIAKQIDPQGIGRFVYNVPLFPWLLGNLMPSATPQSALRVISILNALSLFISSLLLVHHGSRGSSFNRRTFLLIAASISGLFTLFTGHYGCRPEILATLILIISASLTAIVQKAHVQRLILAFGLGLMAATHPAAALIASAGIALYWIVQFPERRLGKDLLLIYILSLLVFFAALAASPFSVREIIQGTWTHYRTIMGVLSRHLPLSYYFFYANSTFYLVLFGFFVFCLFHLILTDLKNAAQRLKALTAATLLVLLTIKLSLMSTRTGPLFLFAPLFYLVILDRTKVIQNKFFYGLSLTLMLMTAIGGFRSVALFPHYLKSGVRLEQARNDFARLLATSPASTFGITDSLWVLSEDYGRFKYCQYLRPTECPMHQSNFSLLWQQSGTPHITPPQQIHDLPLRTSSYAPGAPQLFGVKLAHTIPGYGYAVYRKDQEGSA